MTLFQLFNQSPTFLLFLLVILFVQTITGRTISNPPNSGSTTTNAAQIDEKDEQESAIRNPCFLTGTWKNHRGSLMHLKCHQNSSRLTGIYQSGVGNANGNYELNGSYDSASSTLGWTVAWTNKQHGSSHSTASWTGQYFPANTDSEHHQYQYQHQARIDTTFILAKHVSHMEDRWQSSLVGHDSFVRIPSPIPSFASNPLSTGDKKNKNAIGH